MAITGRTALVAALGALLAPLGADLAARGGRGLLVLGVAVDLALAGRIAALRMERAGPPARGSGSRSRSRCW